MQGWEGLVSRNNRRHLSMAGWGGCESEGVFLDFTVLGHVEVNQDCEKVRVLLFSSWKALV